MRRCRNTSASRLTIPMNHTNTIRPTKETGTVEANRRKYVIMDMANTTEEVAADATKLLSDEHGYWAIREEGREDPYGFDARYEEKAPDVQIFPGCMDKIACSDNIS